MLIAFDEKSSMKWKYKIVCQRVYSYCVHVSCVLDREINEKKKQSAQLEK